MFGYADSGINFDHIYTNRPSGYRWPGLFIDRILLNLPASKATRQRKNRIGVLLRKEVSENQRANRTTRIVDLASGPARYLIELMDETRDRIEALCLDIDRRSLSRGKLVAKDKPIIYKRIDAFQIGRLRRLVETTGWRPNIVLASGLYEYYPNQIVKQSLKEICHFLEPNGLMLFFCQVNNPSKKIMEKLGKTKSGRPWTLFYRGPEEIEAWLIEAGFTDIQISTDQWNMYLTCIGRKQK